MRWSAMSAASTRSLPTTTFWLIHVASAAFGLVAFIVFKIAIGQRMDSTPQDQAAALS